MGDQLAGYFFSLQSRRMSRPLASRPSGGYVLEIIVRGKSYKLPEVSERTLAELGVCDGVTITLRFPHIKSMSSAELCNASHQARRGAVGFQTCVWPGHELRVNRSCECK